MNLSVKTEFDTQFQEIEFFKKMPQMMPWVGANYGKTNIKKVLFVGESAYLEDSRLNATSENWYNSTIKNLYENEIKWSNLRHNIGKPDLDRIWLNISSILKENNKFIEDDNVLINFAVHNFFLRPASYNINNRRFIPDDNDINIANIIFEKTISVLKPDLIIFTTSKAWERISIEILNGFDAYFVPHPACCWWNRTSQKYEFDGSGPLTGAEKFRKIVEHKILL